MNFIARNSLISPEKVGNIKIPSIPKRPKVSKAEHQITLANPTLQALKSHTYLPTKNM
jgi:hypothetical protein